MKSFFQFLSEAETEAASQAKKLGLKGDGHGGWVNRAGEFVAKTVDGKLKFFGKNQKPGRDPDQTPNTKKVEPKLKTKTMSVDKAPQKEKKKGGDEVEKVVGSDTITLAFGRFNPPTVGHEKLLKMAKKVAANGTLRIFPSRTQDKKKNPLDPDKKVNFMRKMFPDFKENIINDDEMRSIFNVLQSADRDFDKVNIIVGSDRQAEFENLAQKYNGELYNFSEIKVISAGARDADAEGVEGMSASKMRKAVVDGDMDSFKKGLPKLVTDSQAKSLFDAVADGMKIKKKEKVTAEMWEIAPKFDAKGLREQYVNGLIYRIGDIVENLNTGLIGKIIRRGTNHLICVTKEEYMFKSWIRDVMEYDEKTMERRMRVPGKPNTLEGTGGYLKNAMAATGTTSIKNFINKYKVKK